MLPPTLFYDENISESKVSTDDRDRHVNNHWAPEAEREELRGELSECVFQVQGPGCDAVPVPTLTVDTRPGIPLKWDPYGRDGPRRCEVKCEWSVEPLAKYLKGVASKIDTNVQNHCIPTNEKLDSFVSRLVANTHRQIKHAPKKLRHSLQSMFSTRFRKFWDFVRNEKVKTATPEELKGALISVIEALTADSRFNSTILAQPTPGRSGVCFGRCTE